jgi:hypothetical protein
MTDSSNQTETPATVSIIESSPDSGLTMKKIVSAEVLDQVKEHTNKVLRYFCFVVAGAIAASVWSLNSEIYKAVGETGGGTTKAQEIEIEQLKGQIHDLKTQLNFKDCMENKKVINKAGCYHD